MKYFKKKYFLIVSIFLIFLILYVALADKNSKEEKIAFVQVSKDENRSRVFQKNHKRLYDYTGYCSPFGEHEVQKLLEKGNTDRDRWHPQNHISKIQFKEDVQTLFALIKEYYALYEYCGGDIYFTIANNRIIEKIEKIDESKDETLSVIEFQKILLSEFDFIQDMHFRINNQPVLPLYKEQFYYANQEIEYYRDQKGFYYYKDGYKNYLLKVVTLDNQKIFLEELMKPSLNTEGEPVYYPGILSPVTNSYEIELKFYGEDESYRVDLYKDTPSKNRSIKKSVERGEQNGVPVLFIRSMHIKTELDLDNLVSFVEKQKESPVTIIDLRDNRGGLYIIPFVWFRCYTGKEPNTGKRIALLLNNTYRFLLSDQTSRWSAYIQSRVGFSVPDPLKPSESMEKKLDGPIWHIKENISMNYDNSNKIFVLINKNTASAAEWFIYDLMHIENVFFVGTNTTGAQSSGGAISFVLPHTQILIKIPSVSYSPVVVEEGKGYMPDLWLNGDETLEKVAKFAKSVQ